MHGYKLVQMYRSEGINWKFQFMDSLTCVYIQSYLLNLPIELI